MQSLNPMARIGALLVAILSLLFFHRLFFGQRQTLVVLRVFRSYFHSDLLIDGFS